MKCFIALGKTGDILSILPILHDEFTRTRVKPKLVVSRDYASVLQAVSYVEPIIHANRFDDLSGAIKLVKSLGMEAVPLQVFGQAFPIQKTTPSFQLDQWTRGGVVDHFHEWPLVIDRRNHDKERALCKAIAGKRHFILLADYSESSPFWQKEDLAKLLVGRFGATHAIIRLSEVRAHNFQDLLGLYHQASLLVSIETAHLHLSRAVSTPVVALATDIPSRWHGSAWHPRYAFHCRYGDFQERTDELLAACDRVLNRKLPVETEMVKTQFPHGYNASVIENSPVMVYRYHPDKSWKTELAIDDGKGTHLLSVPGGYENYSKEDARLFWFNGKLHASLVLVREVNGMWRAAVAYGELQQNAKGWQLVNIRVPNYGRNHWNGMEKNWVFFEHQKRLFCIYGNDPDQTVLEINGEQLGGQPLHSPSLPWKYGAIRGGCIIAYKDKLLRFFHSHTTTGDRLRWIYYIGAMLMENRPPFKPLAISQRPIIAGIEKWMPDCRHWKQNVVFPGGVTREGAGWKLCYGVNDAEIAFARLSLSDLNL